MRTGPPFSHRTASLSLSVASLWIKRSFIRTPPPPPRSFYYSLPILGCLRIIKDFLSLSLFVFGAPEFDDDDTNPRAPIQNPLLPSSPIVARSRGFRLPLVRLQSVCACIYTWMYIFFFFFFFFFFYYTTYTHASKMFLYSSFAPIVRAPWRRRAQY